MFNNIKTDIEQYRSFGYLSKKSQMYRGGICKRKKFLSAEFNQKMLS